MAKGEQVWDDEKWYDEKWCEAVAEFIM